MAFGVNRRELQEWKRQVRNDEIAVITHYWYDERFPGNRSVTKVGCSNLERLADWCRANGLDPKYIHRRELYPHFDVIGSKQREVLARMGRHDLIEKFQL